MAGAGGSCPHTRDTRPLGRSGVDVTIEVTDEGRDNEDLGDLWTFLTATTLTYLLPLDLLFNVPAAKTFCDPQSKILFWIDCGIETQKK